MSKKKKPSTRVPSQLEAWKGIRKDPTPPGRTIQPKDRDLTDEVDSEEIEEGLLDWESYEDDA